MNLLLDTHAFIWWDMSDPRLDDVGRTAITDPANRIIVSAASVWEISIKRSTGKLVFHDDTLAAIARNGFETISISPHHADQAGALPMHHADPFDRLLIAQARIENFMLLTQDRKLALYGTPILGMT